MHCYPSHVPLPVTSQSAWVLGAMTTKRDAVNTKLAEYIVAAIVVAWLLSVVVALIDPTRGETASSVAPVVGTIAGGAVAILTLSKRKNGNGEK